MHRNDVVLGSYFLILSVNEHILPKPSKAKSSRQSIKCRILQEDSCSRLSRILQRHALNLTPTELAHDFLRELIPPLDILEKSIFILFKQLRYTPFARVISDQQFLLQKTKPSFRHRDFGRTIESRATGVMDDLEMTVLDSDGDDMFFSSEPTPRRHLESPYPPLEQDLNAWLEEEKSKKSIQRPTSARTVEKERPEDSDSPYEDNEIGIAVGHSAEVKLYCENDIYEQIFI